ncbi:hypothetical protein [Geomicrobium sediminis]|uniref:Uncharacterized protein n=1 Tax=Geomicrobium sediminis TaxID=1347788 RepID=A0ABS2PBZ6_9BACL|nr:hypothetical protein [Geomicrobium sediminis]MBM7632949.1 hypothetical protein [Geomicrobium sediminis]
MNDHVSYSQENDVNCIDEPQHCSEDTIEDIVRRLQDQGIDVTICRRRPN